VAGELIKRGNFNLSSNGAPGQEISDLLTGALLGVDDKLPTSNVYRENRGGAVDTTGSNAIPVEGTDSIFNPFYIFRYARFGSTDGKTYDANQHRNFKPLATSPGVTNSTLSYFQDKKDRF
jgi:hypothetical protein